MLILRVSFKRVSINTTIIIKLYYVIYTTLFSIIVGVVGNVFVRSVAP